MTIRAIAVVFQAIVLTVLSVPASVLAAETAGNRLAAQTSFDIPSQPLSTALKQLADQAGIQILFEERLVRGLEAPAIKASQSTAQALNTLLDKTGLEFTAKDETVAIRRKGESTTTHLSALGDTSPASREEHRVSQQSAPSSGDGTGARSEDEKPAQGADRSVENDGGAKLEEIVVTAQKRKERLQDVPISIGVVTADDIDRRGLVSSADYLRGLPGVSQVESGIGGQAIVIRGLATALSSQNTIGNGGPVAATYFGETPTTTSAGFTGSSVDIKVVDIERVEVLRGPQGTAFGSSAMTGAVRTIPVAPKLDRFESKAAAGYSATSGTGGDNYHAQAVGNFPLITDKLAVRAVGYWFEDSGFYRNVGGSDAAFQAAMAPYAVPPEFFGNAEHMGTTRFTGGRVAALFQASDALRFTLTYLTQKSQEFGDGGSNTGGYTQTALKLPPEHLKDGHEWGVTDMNIDLFNGLMEYDLGWADLLATYSHTKSGTHNRVAWTALGYPWPVSDDFRNPHREDNSEIRLATKLNGAWDGLVGLYAEKFENKTDQRCVWYGDPATNLFAPGARFMGCEQATLLTKQRAAFSEVSWKFLPKFKLTGGVRAYHYDRDTDDFGPGPAFAFPRVQNSGKASGTTYRANLSYQPVEDALLYAGWSQGFRLGTPQSGAKAALCDLDGDGIVDGTSTTIASTRLVNSDAVDNYELGAKFAGLGNRLTIDAAIYRMDWSGIPVAVSIGNSNCQLFPIQINGGTARSDGVELQTHMKMTEAVRLNVGGSYVHATFVEAVPSLGIAAGDKLPGAPAVNGNLGLEYEFVIGGLRPTVRVDAVYVGGFRNYAGQTAVAVAGGYTKVDLSARAPLGKTNLDLFVRNVTNLDEFSFGGDNPNYGYRLRPRTIGLQVSHEF